MSFYNAWGWVLVPLSYIVALILTAVSIPYLQRFQLMDYPNDRSSHEQPLPRGGGIAIVVIFIAILALFFMDAAPEMAHPLLTLLLAGGLVAAIGLYDDIRPMSPLYRFILYGAVVAASIYSLGAPTIPLGGYTVEAQWAVYALEFLVLLWVLNFFNFMDGIDAIAAIEAIFIALVGGVILAINAPGHSLILPLLCLAAASGGFLVWNYPPARVFMGDVASGFLGLILALIGVITCVDGSMNIWVWFILYGVFFVDATTTLLRHIGRRQSLHIAHRNHAYQRVVLVLQNRWNAEVSSPHSGKRDDVRRRAHQSVSLSVLAINFLWLAPWAFAAAFYPHWAVYATVVALLPLVVLAIKLGAGSKREIQMSLFQ